MPVLVRDATLEDAQGILDIYEPNVLNTPITFDYEVPSVEFFRQKISELSNSHAFLVTEEANDILGFAYASTFREKAAYKQSAETTIYIRSDAQRSCLASKLYRALLDRLSELGFHIAVAGITVPNDASIVLHKKLGFERIGRMKEIGRKFDQWHDVEFWQLKLTKK